MTDPELRRKCTEAYLKQRAEFQQQYLEKGLLAKIKKKHSDFQYVQGNETGNPSAPE